MGAIIHRITSPKKETKQPFRKQHPMMIRHTLQSTTRLALRRATLSTAPAKYLLLTQLESLDTASLCDADKVLRETSDTGLSVITGLQPVVAHGRVMVGTVRTVKVKIQNDLLAVIQGLFEASADEVLVVSTMGSRAAVAGELFVNTAVQRGLAGLLVDGGMRDTYSLSKTQLPLDDRPFRAYAAHITPYAGTASSCAGKHQVPVIIQGVKVSPGDIVVADSDGIVVASEQAMKQLVPTAQAIQAKEDVVLQRIQAGESLFDLTNYAEHVERLERGEDSDFEFCV